MKELIIFGICYFAALYLACRIGVFIIERSDKRYMKKWEIEYEERIKRNQ